MEKPREFSYYHFFSAKSGKGFTIVELLVVISIIGLLSSVILTNINTARMKARDGRRLFDMNQIQIALALYLEANDKYPGPTWSYGECSAGCGCWDTSRLDSDGDGRPFIEPLIDNGFMGKVPTDPSDTPTASCGGYDYYRYDAGSNGCSSSRGAFYVLGIGNMETTGNPHPTSPGWACSGRDWQNEFEWVTGSFEL